MQLILRDDLAFVSVTVVYLGRLIEVPDVIVDTGSATTLLSADYLARIGVVPHPQDVLYTIRGVGGTEVVFSRQVDCLQIDEQPVYNFDIEVGGIYYGFPLNGILGMDYLLRTGAMLNLKTLEITFPSR